MVKVPAPKNNNFESDIFNKSLEEILKLENLLDVAEDEILEDK